MLGLGGDCAVGFRGKGASERREGWEGGAGEREIESSGGCQTQSRNIGGDCPPPTAPNVSSIQLVLGLRSAAGLQQDVGDLSLSFTSIRPRSCSHGPFAVDGRHSGRSVCPPGVGLKTLSRLSASIFSACESRANFICFCRLARRFLWASASPTAGRPGDPGDHGRSIGCHAACWRDVL